MARRLEGRTFTVSVIGLSGTEKEKGQYGVGKSCLCNRFINQEADGYYQEHISVLSQSDFAGRVINNNHFLYWGSVNKTDDGNNFAFQVVEQTEFIDDVSFSPFKTARTEPYTKRAVQPRVTSAEKLMYICKDQLGMETDSAYQQVVMPEGKLTMDGFLCCFDVSKVPQRVIEKQVEFVAALLNNILKLKKPVVLATTKGDSSCPEYVKEAEKLLNRKEFKGSIPLVETSAHENINTEAAFMLLAHLIDKTKARTKILPFAESRKQRHEVLKVAKEAYLNLLRNIVSDSKSVWNAYRRKLEPHSDFVHYVELFGSDQAKKEFRAHTKRLRDEHIRSKENRYLRTLPQLLKFFIPSLECLPERGWNTVRRVLREHPHFDHHFVMVEGEEGCYSWKQVDSFLDDPDEARIPFDLLNSSEAELCFCDHLNELQAQHRRIELQRELKLLLEENTHVLPGVPLSETYVSLVGKECYNHLDDADRQHVYDVHMEELKHSARKDFLELLWEKSHVFWGWNTSAKLTHQDLQSITAALQDDSRYKKLDHLEENRRVMILNHLGFIQSPSRERCGYTDLCIDTQVENLLASMAVRPDLKESSSDSIDSGCKTLNLVLLGKDGLAITLNKDIRNLCVDDEYQLDGNSYSLDYRPIDGDVSREQNALATANFKPHGCLCVYNSEETLDYIQESLERSLTNDVISEGETTLMGMPIVLIQASPPPPPSSSSQPSSSSSSPLYGHHRQHSSTTPTPTTSTTTSSHSPHHHQHHHQQPPSSSSSSPLSSSKLPHSNSKELLREKGKALAARLHGEFISCPDSLEEGLLFSHPQIHKALQTVIHACNPGLNGWYLSDQFEPDIRLSMCLMCGDPFPLELPLGPLLNHEMCRVLADTPYCITLDLILESSKQKVEVEVASYHGGNRLHEGTFHGHILVYSTKRKASLATLRAYSETLLQVPKLILAVSDPCGTPAAFFNSELCQTLIEEGNQLADKLGANFMTTTANFTQQTAVFLPFFRTVWDRREDSELQYHDDDTIEEPPIAMPPTYQEKAYYGSRPPAPLPKPYTAYHTNKSSTSNSTDSEPVYDQPNLFHTHYSDSDHEGDRGSSTSPPPPSSSAPPHPNHKHQHPHHHLHTHHHQHGERVGDVEEEDLYSEVIIPNGDRVVKPSLVKARKNVYAVQQPSTPPSQPSQPQQPSPPIMSFASLPSHSSRTKTTKSSTNSTPTKTPVSKLEHRKSLPIMPSLSTPPLRSLTTAMTSIDLTSTGRDLNTTTNNNNNNANNPRSGSNSSIRSSPSRKFYPLYTRNTAQTATTTTTPSSSSTVTSSNYSYSKSTAVSACSSANTSPKIPSSSLTASGSGGSLGCIVNKVNTSTTIGSGLGSSGSNVGSTISNSRSGGNLLSNFGTRRIPPPLSASFSLSLSSSTSSSSSAPSSANNTVPSCEEREVVKDPQEFFRKSCSLKAAEDEDEEAGDEAEEEEEVEDDVMAMKKSMTTAMMMKKKGRGGGGSVGVCGGVTSSVVGRTLSEVKELRSKEARGGWPDSNHNHPHDKYGLYSSASVTHDYDRKKYVPNSRSMSQSQYNPVTAPLAKPEAIEIADYCHVKDAVPLPVAGDSDYQIVEDALPPGHLHRVMSVKPSSSIKERIESEDSDCSSLERCEKQKLSKRSGPNRRKSKHRHQDKHLHHHHHHLHQQQQPESAIYASPSNKWKNLPKAGRMAAEGPSNSASEDNSEGTYDSGLPSSTKLERKRRSFNQRRWRIPSSSLAHHRISSPIIDSDRSRLSPLVQSYDDMAFSPTPIHHFNTLPLHMSQAGPGEEGDCEDLNDSGTWSSKWLKSLRDPDKQRRKDERRRQKEEEKKAKEAQKKLKKKDPKLSTASAGSFALEEFPTAPENPSIPLFVYKCVSHIEAEGLHTEGLYRISGNKSQGELFLTQFVEDPNTDINSLNISVNAIATLIKNFFNELSEPLIPSTVRDELMEAAEMGDKSGRLLMLRGVIKKLPDQNYQLLKYIMTHLFRVAQNQEHNSMGSGNLAKCWWPTMLRLEFKSYEKMIQGTQIPEDIVHALIEQAQFFFYGGNEV